MLYLKNLAFSLGIVEWWYTYWIESWIVEMLSNALIKVSENLRNTEIERRLFDFRIYFLWGNWLKISLERRTLFWSQVCLRICRSKSAMKNKSTEVKVFQFTLLQLDSVLRNQKKVPIFQQFWSTNNLTRRGLHDLLVCLF